MQTDDERIGVMSIAVRDRAVAGKVNEVLSRYGDFVSGRLGVPFKEKGIAVIVVLFEATPSVIGAVSGAIGNIPGITIRSVMLT